MRACGSTRGSITELPLPDATVDAINSTNTIYFVDDLPRAFIEVARVLSAGGRFALGIGDPDMMRTMPVTRHGFRIRPVEPVLETLSAAGSPSRTTARSATPSGGST